MPLIVGLPVLAVGLLLLLLAITVQLWTRPLAEALAQSVPLIGGRIRAGIVRMSDHVERELRSWARGAQEAVVAFLVDLAETSVGLGEAIAAFAHEVAAKLDHAVHVTVHEIIKAFLAPVRAVANRADAAANRLEVELTRLDTWARDVAIPDVRRAVTALDRRLDTLRDVTIPALLAPLDRQLDNLRARVNDVAIPRIRTIEVELPSLRDLAGDARRLAARASEYTGVIAGAFTAAAVVALLRHVRHCQPKTERLCKLDLDELDELLGVGLGLVGLAEIITMIRTTAGQGDELRGIVGLIDRR